MSLRTVLLDSEGLSRLIRDDRKVMAILEQAWRDDLVVAASALTLVEARDPRTHQARFDWAVSRIDIIPVSEEIARLASKLLAQAGLHGHSHAIDAVVAATALSGPGLAAVLTSDPDDMSTLTQGRAKVLKLLRVWQKRRELGVKVHTAIVGRRDGDWFPVEVPSVPGVFTQGRDFVEVEEMARDAIALMLDVPIGEVAVRIEDRRLQDS